MDDRDKPKVKQGCNPLSDIIKGLSLSIKFALIGFVLDLVIGIPFVLIMAIINLDKVKSVVEYIYSLIKNFL